MQTLFNPKYYLKLFLLIILILKINFGFSQSETSISKGLELIGFENIRTLKSGKNLYVSIENNVFRWNVLAITEALDFIATEALDSMIINLVLIEKGIPYYLTKVNSSVWKLFRMGEITSKKISDELEITWETSVAWDLLKSIEPLKPNTGKFDIVVNPQFSFENTQLRKIYETQLNIAPSLEFSMWKGNKFTGQVIFPIHNELGYEGDFIRPGFLTLSQEIRMAKNWISNISIGNFSNSRFGIGLNIWHPFQNENWKLDLNLGLTGYSHFFDNKWTHGQLSTITWSTSLSWYFQKFNMVLKGGAAQYIYNDMGLFATCTRFFGETAIGFFAQANEHNFNGGFMFTIPFPIKKRSSRKHIRLTIPKYYEMNYNSGTELYYGQNFNTNLGINQIKNYTFTHSVKKEIINLLIHTP